MRFLVVLLCLCFVSISAQSQWKSLETVTAQYKIDGSLSSPEVRDTTVLKNSFSGEHYVIKRSADFTYIAIRSNSGTILNAYVISPERIKIMHASAALGQLDMIKEGNEYKAEKDKFDWIYRDPQSHGGDTHPEAVETIEEFYQQFGWMANTFFFGSYREMEMIIDNAHFTEGSRLVISYTSSENGTRAIRFKEGKEEVSISGNTETDQRLHNGYIPASIKLANL